MIIDILKKLDFKLSFEIIHVVGTNGKGSVAHLLHHNLQKKFSKIGLFSSPHLISPYERIKINDQNISAKSFWKIYHQLPYQLNFFATFYIIAMLYFQKHHCDLVILEAGIGGRLDATGAIKGKYALLTSIDYDHVELLGNSLIKIASEKYAIKDDQMTFLLPSSLDNKIIKKLNKPNTLVLKNDHKKYEQRNFLFAKQFLQKYYQFQDIEKIAILGRNDAFIHNNHLTIFDVAHNQAAIEQTLHLINDLDIKQIVIMIKKTKNIANLQVIFKHYQVFYYKKNDQFHDFNFKNWTKITNLQTFYLQQNTSTLYLGSFVLIGALYGFKKQNHQIF